MAQWTCPKCDATLSIDADYQGEFRCVCSHVFKNQNDTDPVYVPLVRRRKQGPGTELKEVLKMAGITPVAGCKCNRRLQQMNDWGVEGCRENFDKIVKWLRKDQKKWGSLDKWKAAAKLLLKNPALALTLNPKDPFPGLVRAAIKRAEE